MEALHGSMEEPDRLNTYRPQMLQEVLALASQNTIKVSLDAAPSMEHRKHAVLPVMPARPPSPNHRYHHTRTAGHSSSQVAYRFDIKLERQSHISPSV
jgi:hypothetical protein